MTGMLAMFFAPSPWRSRLQRPHRARLPRSVWSFEHLSKEKLVSPCVSIFSCHEPLPQGLQSRKIPRINPWLNLLSTQCRTLCAEQAKFTSCFHSLHWSYPASAPWRSSACTATSASSFSNWSTLHISGPSRCTSHPLGQGWAQLEEGVGHIWPQYGHCSAAFRRIYKDFNDFQWQWGWNEMFPVLTLWQYVSIHFCHAQVRQCWRCCNHIIAHLHPWCHLSSHRTFLQCFLVLRFLQWCPMIL